MNLFLLYSPLNQGLKPSVRRESIETVFPFLLYSPLNQGLKQRDSADSC